MTDCALEATYYHDTPELLLTIDTDSWLEDELERSERLEKLLDEYREANPDEDEGTIMRTFPRYVHDRAMVDYNALSEDEQSCEITPRPPTGFYGEGEPVQVFTPNVDNFLSTDVQFVLWEDELGSHVVLRKADAYNGYGHATAYDCLGYDGTEILDFARAIVACDNTGCGAAWDYEPGHNGVDYGHGFGRLPGWNDRGDYAHAEGTEGKKGTLVIDHDERKAFCPVCGVGTLIGSKT